MRALSSNLRRQMESAVLAARREAETAVRASFDGLGVFSDHRPDHLDGAQAQLRNGLRAKWRQHGGGDEAKPLLVAECAYEQWHRLLFARFLAENALLLHPELDVTLSLADCEDLAPELGEPDGWSVAARFAAEILPGIFRLDDPCVVLRLAPEGRTALERILDGLSEEVFQADDSLGWVYQFWQKDHKDAINASERKIGGAELGPVTQLFTETYMVRFLLENSLGAWWAARHPESALVAQYDYLRFDDEGRPAAGSFDGWPERVAEVTVMDPCCGSGHFLVEAFSMLWQMRAEEEGLNPIEAQDAVLRDNLFGLELDPRCVQIAMFVVALQAWKAGEGWRELPTPNIACSGIPVKATAGEWKVLASGDSRLEAALMRLHALFRNADVLGSLIDPLGTSSSNGPNDQQGSFEDADWADVEPLFEQASSLEYEDPAVAVLGAQATGLARAAKLLCSRFVLVGTNVPYLQKARQSERLRTWSEAAHPDAREDLATLFISRNLGLLRSGGTQAVVTTRYWFFLGRYRALRERLLASTRVNWFVELGPGAFAGISGEVVNAALTAITMGEDENRTWGIDVSSIRPAEAKAHSLPSTSRIPITQRELLANPDSRISVSDLRGGGQLLSEFASALGGITTGDSARFRMFFWEVDPRNPTWELQQTPPDHNAPYRGRENVLRWEGGAGSLADAAQHGATIAGRKAWGRRGIALRITGDLPATLYQGSLYENICSVVIPNDASLLPAIWAFCSSEEYSIAVRRIDSKLIVTANTLAKVPFDVDRWRAVADSNGPLPEPASNDPTQWLFDGRPEVSTSPLHVAVGRLLGYRWPEQTEDDLDDLADRDGIMCLPSVAREDPAADRLHTVLARAYGDEWSAARLTALLQETGTKKRSLTDWLQHDFFKQHCALFGQRPFIWHIWDGQHDGFSALVNYHRLDRAMLQKLTHTYLSVDWVERQRAGVANEVTGAEGRLAAALDLQKRLEAVLEGEAPLDIFVRWKETEGQPVGWNPDLDDGVRLNVRPFIQADVLRSKVNVHWRKDRGKNPDGSGRINDIHLSLAEKRETRARRP